MVPGVVLHAQDMWRLDIHRPDPRIHRMGETFRACYISARSLLSERAFSGSVGRGTAPRAEIAGTKDRGRQRFRPTAAAATAGLGSCRPGHGK